METSISNYLLTQGVLGLAVLTLGIVVVYQQKKLATTASFPFTMTASGSGEGNATAYIQYRKVGDTNWIGSSSSTNLTGTITISGLLPNTDYEYRLAADNSTGTWVGTAATIKTLPAGKLVYPNGTVKNAIPRIVRPDGSVAMVNIKLVD